MSAEARRWRLFQRGKTDPPPVVLGLLTLLAVSVLIFAATEILPGDVARAMLQSQATPDNLAKLRLELGLDRPAYVRYVEWFFHAMHGISALR